MPRAARAPRRPPQPSSLARALSERLEALLVERQTVAIDPDAVHRMRVASRRLREALRLADPGRRLQREARRVTRGLGGLREEQVTRGIFAELATRAEGAETEGFAQLLADADQRIEREQQRTNRHLDRIDLGRLEARLRAFLAESGPRGPADPAALDALLPSARRCDELEAAARAQPGEEALHQLRIAVKRLRYAVEIVGGEGEPGKKLAASLKKLQDALGRHHDLWVAGGRAESVRARLASSGQVALAAAVAAAAECVKRAEREAMAGEVTRQLERWPAGAFSRRASRLALPERRRSAIVMGTRALGDS